MYVRVPFQSAVSVSLLISGPKPQQARDKGTKAEAQSREQFTDQASLVAAVLALFRHIELQRLCGAALLFGC